MEKEIEELIRILAKEEEKKELLKEIVKGEFRSRFSFRDVTQFGYYITHIG